MDAIEQPGIGHNAPPEQTPYEAVKKRIDDLYDEARNWLDGEPIDSQAAADAVSNLKAMILAARSEAEENRRRENKPFDDGKAEVQARYSPLIADTKSVVGKTTLALNACRDAIKPWLEKLDREQREREAEARRIADEKAAEARKTMQESDPLNLTEREGAEAKVTDARDAEIAARTAQKATPKSGGGFGRKSYLKTNYVPAITDDVVAVRHYWTTRRDDMKAFVLKLAKEDVAMGKRDIPGFDVKEERKVV